MPDPVTGTIAGVGLIGAGVGLYGSKKASDAQQKAAEQAAAAGYGASERAAELQWDMFQQSREDLAPWRVAGESALAKLMGTPAVTPESTAAMQAKLGPEPVLEDFITPDMRIIAKQMKGVSPWDLARPDYNRAMQQWQEQKATIDAAVAAAPKAGTPATKGLIEQGPGEFKESPSYQFALSEGLKGQQRAASATGRLGSGAYLQDATKYAENLASTEYDNFLKRWYQSLTPWQSMAGIQQSGVGLGVAANQQTGQNIGRNYLAGSGDLNYLYGGEAQAGQYMNYANTGTNFLSGLAQNSLYAYYRNPQQQGGYDPYYGPGGTWQPTKYY